MGAVAVLVHLRFFPYLSRNADEGVYLLQAEALAHGQLTLPASLHAGPFQPWLTGEHDGRVFTKYLPGWPALLAVSLVVTGSATPVLFLVAAGLILAVYAFALELLGSRRAALLAAALTVLSPLFLVHTATFLSYAASAALLLAASACWLRGARLGSRRLLLLAGALYGWAFLVRPFDVLLVAGPVAAYLVVRYALSRRERDPRRLGRALAWAVAGGLPLLGVALAYDAMVTGHPLRLPLPATDPLDRFGFGSRRIMPLYRVRDFTPATAWAALVQQVQTVPSWVFGGALLPAFALLGLVTSCRRRESVLLLGIVLSFPAGYFAFWGSVNTPGTLGVRNGMGPLYWLPAFAALAVLAAAGTERVLRTVLARGLVPAAAALTALTVAGALTALNVHDKIRFHDGVTREYARVAALVPPADGLPTPATVVLLGKYVGNPYPFLRNDPDRRGPIAYATARGPDAVRVAEAAPDRALYALRPQELQRWDDPRGPRGSFSPLQVVRGQQLRIDVALRAPVEGCLTAYLQLDRRHARSLGCGLRPGEVRRTTWVVGGRGGLPLPDRDGTVYLRVGAAIGDRPSLRGAQHWQRRDSLGVLTSPGGRVLTLVGPGPGYVQRAAGRPWTQARVDDVVDVELSAGPTTPAP